MERFRDPIHGFIEARPLEVQIINSIPFQRLRNIKHLAMTNLVFHGAEHTRFGHSLGVMHLVSKAYKSILNTKGYSVSREKAEWHEQILRLIALTHDLGHAPFSHASESVFPKELTHEHFTEKIIKETGISDIIREIGIEFVEKYGKDYDITPELICDIYEGRNPGNNSEFIFLKSFMDSELDCDKMDYLLRDSYYCGVNYGKFDIERLISSLTVYLQDGQIPRLAIESGGVQAFEEFVLARYFMFIQVYFHRTRRFFDIIFAKSLELALPDGKYPEDVDSYLDWDDCRVLQLIKEKKDEIYECQLLYNRSVYPKIHETKTHPEFADIQLQQFIKKQLYEKFSEDNFIEDRSANKMPHKIPKKTVVEDEKAIVILDKKLGTRSTISEESHIIKNLTEKIAIERIYVKPELCNEVYDAIRSLYPD